MESQQCIVCGKAISSNDAAILTPKGVQAIRSASTARNDDLNEKLDVTSSVAIHAECRKQYTRPSSIKTRKRKCDRPLFAPASAKKMRSSESGFDFKRDYMFSGKNACVDSKLAVKRRRSTSEVRTLEFHNTVVQHAIRRADQLGDCVLSRAHTAIDLVAAEAKYHHDCRRAFFLETGTWEIKYSYLQRCNP